ncbi:MAG: hypothetical protein HYV19_10505 [Gemmatimonadetes bacterium]|nr:hypothetical protein [Gemmatimonadota bacterium]
MFRDPLPHLGVSLLTSQLAGQDLIAHGLPLHLELLDERLLFGGRVLQAGGPISGAETSALTGAESRPCPSASASACPGAESVADTGSHSGASADEPATSAKLPEALSRAQPELLTTEPLTTELLRLLTVGDPVGLDASQSVDARERPRLQGALRGGRCGDRRQCDGETKDLDGAHTRLQMFVRASMPRCRVDAQHGAALMPRDSCIESLNGNAIFGKYLHCNNTHLFAHDTEVFLLDLPFSSTTQAKVPSFTHIFLCKFGLPE